MGYVAVGQVAAHCDHFEPVQMGECRLSVADGIPDCVVYSGRRAADELGKPSVWWLISLSSA